MSIVDFRTGTLGLRESLQARLIRQSEASKRADLAAPRALCLVLCELARRAICLSTA